MRLASRSLRALPLLLPLALLLSTLHCSDLTAPEVGSLAVTIDGLQTETQANVTVSGPDGFRRTLNGSATLTPLIAGRYTVAAIDVETLDGRWASTPATQEIAVRHGDPTKAHVAYALTTTRLTVEVGGLPEGTDAAVTVSGPGQYTRTLTATTTLDMLTPGAYTITASDVTVGGAPWTATPPVTRIVLTPATTPIVVPVAYAAGTGALAITVAGVPTGSSAAITVQGPDGYAQAVTATTTLTGLAPGTYTIAAADLVTSGGRWSPSPASQTTTVITGGVATAAVSYALATTRLAVSVGGLPAGATPSIAVSGPAGYAATLSGPQTLDLLAPGTYTITPADVTADGTVYHAAPQTVTLAAATTATTVNVSYAASTGALALGVTGLPDGTGAAITIAGPNGWTRSVSGPETIAGLAPGTYTVTASAVTTSLGEWRATPATQSVTVAAGATATASVSYALATARLTIEITGLPAGTNGLVRVSGPNGFSTETTQNNVTFERLEPGTYTITPLPVTFAYTTYRAGETTVTLAPSTTPVVVGVPYSATTGELVLDILGVPAGVTPTVTVTGPNGYSTTVTGSTTLRPLAPGTYTITADAVTTSEGQWRPTQPTQTVEVSAGAVASASVTYALVTTRLAVVIGGLPAGATASVAVSGPGGYSTTLTASATLDGLVPGTYTITPADVVVDGTTYHAAPVTVTLAASTTPTAVNVTYAAGTGALALTIGGLPAGANAAVTVTGPGGYTQAVTATTTLGGLAPGDYTIAAADVTTSDGRWSPAPATQTATVTAGATAAASVSYAIATARLTVTVSGLPGGTAAAITVTGPNGYSQAVTGTTTLELLAPGSYTITPSDVSAGGTVYHAAPTTVTLAASTTPGTADVVYAALPGALTVTVGGLPAGTNAAVTVTGPGGFSQAVTTTATLTELAPGTYTVAATSVTVGRDTYAPTPASQSVAVTSGATASASVTYALVSAALQLDLQQVVTGLTGALWAISPPGDARLFVLEQPGRVRVVRNGVLLATPFLDIAARVTYGGEQGLLNLAFDPGFTTNGWFYVYFVNTAGDIEVDRYHAAPTADVADAGYTTVLTVPHPGTNHNGGQMQFGTDGTLYISTGDGGSTPQAAQDYGSLLGKLLRIDVRTLPYTIPSNNPFVGQAGRRGEIWAMGLRNPWRWDMDPATGNLVIADVGQSNWEEIDLTAISEGGVNYGWPIMEGTHCYSPSTGCSTTGLRLPVYEYDHTQGCSITGGFVYRGSAIPELAGQYFFSDFCGGWLATMSGVGGGPVTTQRWSVTRPGNVYSFGEDAAGELYMITSTSVYRIVRR